MRKLGDKGQVETAVDAGIFLIVVGIMVLLASQILPTLLDNHIGPAIENRTFGATGILLWELWIPVLIIFGLLGVLMLLSRVGRRQP